MVIQCSGNWEVALVLERTKITNHMYKGVVCSQEVKHLHASIVTNLKAGKMGLFNTKKFLIAMISFHLKRFETSRSKVGVSNLITNNNSIILIHPKF